MADKHMGSKAHEDLHKKLEEKTEGGRCLTGHSYSYDDKTSCTYRWQALQQVAKERHGYYTYEPQYPGVVEFLRTSQYQTKAGEKYPADLGCFVKTPSSSSDWAVDGPLRSDVEAPNGDIIPKGMNYTKWFYPYWNNAHHIIPKGTLKKCINELKKKDPEAGELMVVGILRADYNVNHWINVIILPMDQEVGDVLRLPRHLSLEDETLIAKEEKFDHSSYNGKVKTKLDDIIASYKKTIDQAREGLECNAQPVIKLSKEKLEKLSKDLFKDIISFGQSNPGLPLSDIVL